MHAQRRARLNLPQLKVDAFLISALPNIRYLSGFTGSNALLLVRERTAVLLTDPRYTIQAATECDCTSKTVKSGPLTSALAPELKKSKIRRLGVERNRISWATYQALQQSLPVGVELVAIDDAIENLRMVKDSSEIEAIRASVLLNSKAFSKALRRFKPEMKEFELAAEIDYQMRKLGASCPAFETIVASGPRTALPHAQPGPQSIRNNQLLLVDMGATLNGYASDMTRTLAVGKISAELKRMYQATLESQLAAIDAVKPGIAAGDVDAAARSVLRKNGLDQEFIHSTGHGLGLEIHEMPRLGRSGETRLEPGMTITIEPGVYREGVGGIRIEDTVLVTETGCEILTPTPKELLSI